MERITILDNDFATLWYYPGTKIVHHKIKKYIFGKPLQDLLSKGTEILQQNKAEKWLSDDRSNNAMTIEDQDWANNIWFPKTAKIGWKYWALVQPMKSAGQSNMRKQTNMVTNGGVTACTFDDPDEAMDWLVSQ